MGIVQGYAYPHLDIAFKKQFEPPTEDEKKFHEMQRKIAELISRAKWDKIEQERKDREILYKIAEKLGIDVNPAPPSKSPNNEPDHEG